MEEKNGSPIFILILFYFSLDFKKKREVKKEKKNILQYIYIFLKLHTQISRIHDINLRVVCSAMTKVPRNIQTQNPNPTHRKKVPYFNTLIKIKNLQLYLLCQFYPFRFFLQKNEHIQIN